MEGDNIKDRICIICNKCISDEKVINVTNKGKSTLREVAVLKSDSSL